MELGGNQKILLTILLIVIIVLLIFYLADSTTNANDGNVPPIFVTPNNIYTYEAPSPANNCTDCIMTESGAVFESDGNTDPISFFWDGGIQSDGKIIAGGRGSVTRYNTDGTRDLTFGTSGWFDITSITVGGGIPNLETVEIDASDNIFISMRYVGGAQSLYIIKLLPDGSADASFGSGGVFTINNGVVGSVGKPSIAVHSSGNIYFITDRGGFLGRVLPTGVIDSSFGTSGYANFSWNGFSAPTELSHYAVEIYNDKLYVSVYERSTYLSTGVVRLNLDGTKDTTYGTGGDAVFDFSTVFAGCQASYLDCFSGGVAPDGSYYNLVTVTYDETQTCGLNPISVVKFTPEGTVDTGFADNGIFIDLAEPFWANVPYSECYKRPTFDPCTGNLLAVIVSYGNDDTKYILQLTSDGTQILNSTYDSLPTNTFYWSCFPHPDGFLVALGEDFDDIAVATVNLFNCANLDYTYATKPW